MSSDICPGCGEKVGDICPRCGKEGESDPDGFYCPHCDTYFDVGDYRERWAELRDDPIDQGIHDN